MPNKEEREEILRCVASKLKVSKDVDFAEVASWCENYTGADLQALLYNAQLMSIHSMLEKKECEEEKEEEQNFDNSFFTFDLSSQNSKKNFTASQKHSFNEEAKTVQSNLLSSLTTTSPKPTSSSSTPNTQPLITFSLLKESFKNLRPSVSEEDRIRFQKIYDSFRFGRREANFNTGPKDNELRQTLY